MFSSTPLSDTPRGGHGGAEQNDIVMLAPVSVQDHYLHMGIGSAMLTLE